MAEQCAKRTDCFRAVASILGDVASNPGNHPSSHRMQTLVQLRSTTVLSFAAPSKLAEVARMCHAGIRILQVFEKVSVFKWHGNYVPAWSRTVALLFSAHSHTKHHVRTSNAGHLQILVVPSSPGHASSHAANYVGLWRAHALRMT